MNTKTNRKEEYVAPETYCVAVVYESIICSSDVTKPYGNPQYKEW